MSQNNISAQLAQKITHFLQYQYTLRQQARSADMDVPLLELLSPQLHGELQFARFEKELCKLQVVHDLVFEGADRQVVHILQRVSQDAVKNNVVAAADVIFLAGNHAASAYLKLSGDLTYCYEDGEEEVGSGFWSAEVALWTPWVYLGDLVSTDVSRVASLDVQSFCHAMMDSWQTQRCASRYASKFLDAWPGGIGTKRRRRLVKARLASGLPRHRPSDRKDHRRLLREELVIYWEGFRDGGNPFQPSCACPSPF
eukprot:g2293.t1